MRLRLDEFRSSHSQTDVVVLEPKQSDATLFMYSPMNFAARRAILEEGYTSTARLLSDADSPLRQTLAKHGLNVVV